MSTNITTIKQKEEEKYATPVAPREEILRVLEESEAPQSLKKMIRHFGYEDDESRREGLRRRMIAMVRDGQIMRNQRGRFGPLARMDLVAGRVQGHPDGFGFLIPEEPGEDIFLSQKEMRLLMDGDRVVVSIIGVNRRGKREGQVAEVLDRAVHQVVGRYFHEKGIGIVVPSNKRIAHDIIVPENEHAGATHDQIVLVEIIEPPSKHSAPIGRVVEVLGDHMAPGMEIDVAIRSFEIPHTWSADVEREAAQTPSQVTSEDAEEIAKKQRTDFRHLPLVTIDGEDARDFDDAVWAARTPKGWKLLVAIADVSRYVQPDSPLDREAVLRGNSVYFPEHVVPMLPEALSNGICSLNPEVDRLCMVCEMVINESGHIIRSKFHRGMMHSVARMTYTDVGKVLSDDAAEQEGLDEKYTKYLPQLQTMHELYQVLRKARSQRGAIDFETVETKIVFGKERKIDQIVPVERNDAHKMIEEFMIAANVCAARYLQRHKMPTLYRIHEKPDADRLEEVRQFLLEFGLTLPGGDRPQPSDYAKVLELARERPEFNLIQTVLLRSLNRAVYHPRNVGHFGLAHENYAHFTSPIRRYPDLLVHRAINHVLLHENAQRDAKDIKKSSAKEIAEMFVYDRAGMVKFGEQCSMTERRADDATRDAIEWLKCEYMTDHVGEVFDGVVSGVTGFGLFVTLDGIFVDGLVHITALQNDYYHFDPVRHQLKGEKGRNFRLGDPVTVQVARVDLDERKIDFLHVGNDADVADFSESEPLKPKKVRKSRKRKKFAKDDKNSKSNKNDTSDKSKKEKNASKSDKAQGKEKRKRSKKRVSRSARDKAQEKRSST